MSDYAIIFQVLGVIGLLFFFFLTYMNTKTWRWPHVTMMFFVLAAAITFMVFAAMELKTRTTWMEKVTKLEKDLDTRVSENRVLLRGPDNEVRPQTPSVISIREQLGRIIVDRGRVWRDCLPTINQDRSITLSMAGAFADPAAVPADPAAPQAAPVAAGPGGPKKHNILPKTVLHAFKEYQNAEGTKSPRFYLGQFAVTDATETAVTIAPTIPLSNDQMAEAVRGDATWVLYETAPVDNHAAFADLEEADLAALFPIAQLGLDAANYKAFLEQYTRDGKAANANDPPDNVWLEVKFIQPHEVAVDSVQPINTVDTQPFDGEGQAQLSRLRRGESVKFKPGDIGIFDQATANQLVADGIAGEPKPIFRRRLNDYEFSFNAIHRRVLALDQQMKDLSRDIATVKEAEAKSQSQITAHTEAVEKLSSDITKVTYERDELTKYTSTLDARVNQVKAALSKLYAQNRALSRELSAITAKLTEEADRRTREATAMTP
jgi:archaellum component FlaC